MNFGVIEPLRIKRDRLLEQMIAILRGVETEPKLVAMLNKCAENPYEWTAENLFGETIYAFQPFDIQTANFFVKACREVYDAEREAFNKLVESK